MDLGLQGRRAIVFGSTAGLGRATAETLAAEGALVAISGRRAEVAAEIAASLPGAVAVVGDLTVEGEPARMVERGRGPSRRPRHLCGQHRRRPAGGHDRGVGGR